MNGQEPKDKRLPPAQLCRSVAPAESQHPFPDDKLGGCAWRVCFTLSNSISNCHLKKYFTEAYCVCEAVN